MTAIGAYSLGDDLTTFFEPGAGVGIVRGGTLALFDPMNTELAVRLWDLVDTGAGVDELLELVSAQGLRSLGSFVLAQVESGSLRLVVRGSARVVIGIGDRSETIDAGGARTWNERVVPAPEVVTLRLADADGQLPPTRITAGLVPATALARGSRVPVGDWQRSLDWDAVDAALGLLPGPAGSIAPATAVPIPVVPPSAPEPAPVAADVGVSPPLDAVLDAEALAAPDDDADSGRTLSAREFFEASDQMRTPVSSGDAPHSAAAEAESSSAAPDDEHNDFDEIWGRTVARSVQTAAVHQVESEEEQPPIVPSPVLPASGAAPSPAATPTAPGLIEAIPTASASPPAATAAGDHDGRTMTKAQLAAMRAERAGIAAVPVASQPVAGPTVQAVLCPSGHPNPTQRAVCRLCGVALSGTPVLVARPVLATLRFADGNILELDRPTLFGRNPKVEGAVANELPRLHALDVGQGLSRTHAIIKLEGWQVLIEDLNSANGTIVTLPGREPRRLHPGEPVMLESGSAIDFGGEVTCTVTM